MGELRENVTLTTAEPGYAWVNSLQIWAGGTVDLAKGEAQTGKSGTLAGRAAAPAEPALWALPVIAVSVRRRG